MVAGSFNLYVELEKDQKIDIEVAGRAAIELSQAIKELAFVIDPSLNIKVELVSGEEGSLWLKSWVRNLNVKDKLSTKNLLRVLFGTVALFVVDSKWFKEHVREYVFEKVLDHFVDTEPEAHITKEDLRLIAEEAVEAVDRRSASPHIRQVYRELQSDKAVRGVGAGLERDRKPIHIVPRSEFPARSGSNEEKIQEYTRRSRESRERLVLVSPVLLNSDRRWEFTGREGKVSAAIKDKAFLENIMSGETGLRMVGGIELDVDLQTNEEFQHGVWHILSRNILRVYGQHPGPSQSAFTFDTSHRSEKK